MITDTANQPANQMTSALMLHPEIEQLSPAALRQLQDEKWARQCAYVADRSSFYARKLGNVRKAAASLEALKDTPLTDKEEIRDSQQECYPYGDYIACEPDQVVRLHRTSGTTGKALILANTAKDLAIIAEQGGRGMVASGLRPGDKVIHCLNYCLWTGGVTDHMILEATGATVIPFGVGNTKLLVNTILELGITAISCTPSYPALLEKVLREEFDKVPCELGLRLALFGGEPGLDNPAFREGLEARWGFGARNANFGMSEVMSIMGSQCEHTTDLHYLSGDMIFYEILDPSSGERLDCEEGVTGELVCTHLEKQCQPLIRYRTRDVITITGTDVCGCGRRSMRFRVTGRTDDMFNVRGVNVFPTAVQKVVLGFGELTSGHFRIQLQGSGPYDRIVMRVEAARDLPEIRWTDAKESLERAIQQAIGATASIQMIGFEALQRTAGKTSLVERS